MSANEFFFDGMALVGLAVMGFTFSLNQKYTSFMGYIYGLICFTLGLVASILFTGQ